MFGAYQPVLPNRIALLIKKYIPKGKAGIVRWFEEGPFDERLLAGKPSRLGGGSDAGDIGKGSAPASREVRYWVFGERVAEPLHSRLQAKYMAFLRSQGHNPAEDVERVDIRYRESGSPVFVEVKPTEKVPPRFAIRAAIGQLLEYRHTLDASAELEIIISSQPEQVQVELLKSLGIRLWFQNGTRFERLA